MIIVRDDLDDTAACAATSIEVTVFEKTGGPLTKRITLREGKIVNDGSACFMSNGSARRVVINSMHALADLINTFKPNEAYALGRLKDGLPAQVQVVRKEDLNGGTNPSIIARSLDYLTFNEGKPGLVLLDFDIKGMSESVHTRMEECENDFWGALVEVLPAFETVACVERASTSSGLRNRETGESFPGSGGRHVVVPVVDAADIPRFLSDLHDRCWLAGFGWGMVSAAGSFLERGIIDKSVGSPERLIFEGAPIIEPPLVQTGRNAVAHEGFVLDTRLCPPLTDDEKARVRELKAAEDRRLLPERQAARAKWSTNHIARLTAGGMPEPQARATVDRWIDRQELSGAFSLPFDDADLDGATVNDVLIAPERYISKTMADPFEGKSYGWGKARLFRCDNGSLCIHSFAHGGAIYTLVNDARSSPLPPLTLAEWFARELPPPDFLTGSWLTTTSRGLLSAPSGLGKTNIVIALGMRGCACQPFLHWERRRPFGGLYVDGEMSRRLLKQRLVDEANRLGVAPPTSFRALSREDVEDFKPLNTPEGMRDMLTLIDRIGGIDLVIFDSVMCLLTGNMADEEPWAQTMPLVRELTRRRIGQLWVHHTGLDKTRSYGTNTREWQMDLVLHLEEIKRPDTDVSFLMHFQKARERTPETRRDFQDVEIALVNDLWEHRLTEAEPKVGHISPAGQKFLAALINVLAGADTVRTSSGRPAATNDAWLHEAEHLGLIDPDARSNNKSALLSKYRRELVTANRVACEEKLTWLLR